MKINISANKLNKKVSDEANTKRGQKTINKVVADKASKSGTDRERMIKIANMFIQVLKDTASSRIGYTAETQSIQKHFDSLKATEPSLITRNGKTYGVIYVYFSDEDLSRESLLLSDGRRTGDGINNIIALFNNGYEIASKITPRGIWEGHNDNKAVRAKRKRERLEFMQSAASIVKRTYKDVDAIILSNEYDD